MSCLPKIRKTRIELWQAILANGVAGSELHQVPRQLFGLNEAAALLKPAAMDGVELLLIDQLFRGGQAGNLELDAAALRSVRKRQAGLMRRSMMWDETVASVAQIFSRAGLSSPILLKGLGLRNMVYENPLLRESVDMDLLVPAREVERIGEVFAAEGWAGVGVDCWHSTPLTKGSGRSQCKIDLHYALDVKERCDAGYDELVPHCLLGAGHLEGLLVPDLPAQLATGIVHMHKHGFAVAAKSMVDIGLILAAAARKGQSMLWRSAAQVFPGLPGFAAGGYLAGRICSAWFGPQPPHVGLPEMTGMQRVVLDRLLDPFRRGYLSLVSEDSGHLRTGLVQGLCIWSPGHSERYLRAWIRRRLSSSRL